jgi:hypothetical protein
LAVGNDDLLLKTHGGGYGFGILKLTKKILKEKLKKKIEKKN